MCELLTGVQTCAFPIFWLHYASRLNSSVRPHQNKIRRFGLYFGTFAARDVAPAPVCSARQRFRVRPGSQRSDRSAASGSSADTLSVRPRSDSSPLVRSEEHTSELQSLMRISYAVFC